MGRDQQREHEVAAASDTGVTLMDHYDRPAPALALFRAWFARCLRDTDTLGDELRLLSRALPPREPYHAHLSLPRAVTAALAADQGGRDAYFGVHPRRADAAAGTAGGVRLLVGAVADVDYAKLGLERAAVLDAIRGFPLWRPTAIVHSGGGFHVYARYARPVDPADPVAAALHLAACEAMRRHLDGALGVPVTDNVADWPRILRVPGTRNHKPERGGAVVGLTEVNVEAEISATALGALPSPRPRVTCAASQPDTPRIGRHHWEEGDIREALRAAGAAFREKRCGASAILICAPCPLCGDTRGKCFVRVADGRLQSHRQNDCPAGRGQSGVWPDGRPRGLPFHWWTRAVGVGLS